MAPPGEGPLKDWILDPWQGQAPSRAEAGGKAAGLESLRAAGARVPRFLALKAQAYDALAGRPLPEAFSAALRSALEKAGLSDKPLAFRSSALSEDSSQASYAGIFETVLAVGAQGAAEALAQVWESARSPRALAYARRQDPAAEAPRMGVVIQELLDPAASGVAFTADPVSGAGGSLVISGVYGLGEALVSGELDGDTWRLGPQGTHAEIRPKPKALRRAPDSGTRWEEIPAGLGSAPCLSGPALEKLALECRRLEAALGGPQDLEWAVDGAGAVWMLQARPITAMAPRPRVWDNANIVESYGGVTLPLTFSFACAVYEQAYLVFSRYAGVPEPVLKAHADIFSRRLGLHRGRVYYDLINWYRNLALLPFYRFNKGAMEGMMGVVESLPEDMPRPSGAAETWRAAKVALRLALAALRSRGNEARFHAMVDAVLLPMQAQNPQGLAPAQLAARFEGLWRGLLLRWETPIVHDVFAMASLGLMQALLRRWQPGQDPALAAELLRSQGGMASAEPARRMQALARQWRADPALSGLFMQEPDDAKLWKRVAAGHPLFHRELKDYLDRWGLRCEGELKLETTPLSAQPAVLVGMLRTLHPRGEAEEASAAMKDREALKAAEERAFAGLGWPRRKALEFSVRWARASMLSRENLRFERTRAYGEVRRIMLALGAAFASSSDLHDPRDVFYLNLDEVLKKARGEGLDLKALVAGRKAQYAAWAAMPPPPPRFRGEPPLEAAPLAQAGRELKGMGACAGRVRGRVRLVADPAQAGDLRGRILCAERTDPGWTLVFPQAAGLLVERGSLLSHSAVVARELGLPCVVGIADLMRSLDEGEEVEMDGTTGRVLRLEKA